MGILQNRSRFLTSFEAAIPTKAAFGVLLAYERRLKARRDTFPSFGHSPSEHDACQRFYAGAASGGRRSAMSCKSLRTHFWESRPERRKGLPIHLSPPATRRKTCPLLGRRLRSRDVQDGRKAAVGTRPSEGLLWVKVRRTHGKFPHGYDRCRRRAVPALTFRAIRAAIRRLAPHQPDSTLAV